jgi:hypothetical protein
MIVAGPLQWGQVSGVTLETVSVFVPLKFGKRGTRRLVLSGPLPESGASCAAHEPDPKLMKALARAFRWKRMIESCEYGSVEDLAAKERINKSYLCRTMRLTLLAPDLVEAILNGTQPRTLTLGSLIAALPDVWDEQRALFA